MAFRTKSSKCLVFLILKHYLSQLSTFQTVHVPRKPILECTVRDPFLASADSEIKKNQVCVLVSSVRDIDSTSNSCILSTSSIMNVIKEIKLYSCEVITLYS